MLISKASFNVNTLVVVVETLYRDSASGAKTLDIRPIPYTVKQISEPFPGAAGECFQIAVFDCDLYFLPLFIEIENNPALPFHSFLSSAVAFGAFSSCNTHTNSLLRSFLSQQSLCFSMEETGLLRLSRVCIFLLLLFSKLFNAGTRTHTKTLVGADCCCFVRLQKSHFYLESAQHTTSDSGNILSCLFHSSRDDTDRKRRTGQINFRQFPKTTVGSFVRSNRMRTSPCLALAFF